MAQEVDITRGFGMGNEHVQLNPFEMEVLKTVAQGKSKSNWSWYNIAIRVNIHPRQQLMVTLKRLNQLGLLERTVLQDSGLDYWRITDLGESVLKTQQE